MSGRAKLWRTAFRVACRTGVLAAGLAGLTLANAWSVRSSVEEGQSYCSLDSKNPDGSSVSFITMKETEQNIGMFVAKPGWTFTDDQLYPNIQLGTADGHFGPADAHGAGNGLIIIIPRPTFDDFIRYGATEDASLRITNGNTVLALFALKGIREKYAELIACDTAKNHNSLSLPKDPFQR